MSDSQVPEPDHRALLISESDDAALEQIRQHALGMMDALLHGQGTAPPEYMGWSCFVGEIETEQRRRRLLDK